MKFTKQLMLKMTNEQEKVIDVAFIAYLQATGEPITRSEYVRRLIMEGCAAKIK